MTHTRTRFSDRIARRAGQQGARSAVVPAPATVFEKSDTEPNKNMNKHTKNNSNDNSLLKCKRNTLVSTFNVRTLTSLSQMSELAASAAKWNIDIICIQEHRFYHEEIELKHHKFSKGLTFISASASKNSMNSPIGGGGMLLKSSCYVIIEQYGENPSKDVDCHFER